MKWMIGIYRSHLVKDPLNISCCISWMVFPAILAIGMILVVRDIRGTRKEIAAAQGPPRGRDPRARQPPLGHQT